MNVNRGINHIGLTVPDMEVATDFFKKGLNGKIAYDSQKKTDEPRGGDYVEHILGLEKGASIIHKRMMVFGNGPNIEMFEFKDAHQGQSQALQDIGYTHISFYVEAEAFERVLEQVKEAGGEPISEPHSNTKYEDTEGNKTVYVKSPWGSLIELQTIPHGYYYPNDSEASVFIPTSFND
ncbi:VOC family protein [Staphylococcus sp. NRL 16/872]|uniref:VOC family protein n=1 Tax=Staphylococcus sp. NRL 16/872 TaxID=2930131 RepID=UPI001FB2D933|nr:MULTISPECIES: VOC family protein [unclassified Staphylococcus]MCJ1655267.1 VOC family protein [Staphylococcus sp. NRL 21/187]MCJ1661101.1 VOC family protein [Staphylococcus sp. NRL 18/288]MCJ1666998.1 VOC family protein [Staphylococcus sp. NRL 19/737]WEN69472.1 VOC family protein [Staphylococcus sp. NRL 16/872]